MPQLREHRAPRHLAPRLLMSPLSGGNLPRFSIIGLLIVALVAHLFDFDGLSEVLLSLAGIVALGVLLFTLARSELDTMR